LRTIGAALASASDLNPRDAQDSTAARTSVRIPCVTAVTAAKAADQRHRHDPMPSCHPSNRPPSVCVQHHLSG